MQQLNLFPAPALPTGEVRLPAAKADPGTSFQAARQLRRSGELGEQCRLVLGLLNKLPGATSFEIARRFGADRHMVAKRLADLEREGFAVKCPARKCEISGRNSVTWKARKAGDEQ